MFEKEAEEYTIENVCSTCHFEKPCENKCEAFGCADSKTYVLKAFIDGAEFGYNRAGEWHFIKDKLPPEPLVVGDRMFPKNYICAYSLNNKYNDYEIGDFLYYGNGEFNGENKDYPIYAWLEKPTVIPLPPKEE